MTETLPPPSPDPDWLLAALTPGLGPRAMLALLQRHGSLRRALASDLATLCQTLPRQVAQALKCRQAAPAVGESLDWLQRTPGAFLLSLQDADYPLALAESPSPPSLLFGLGQRSLLARPKLAIVGSRHAGPQACRLAHDYAAALAEHGYCIVSGMASGIDSSAHQGALRHAASSIAVIGTGIDRVYPANNRQLARHLAQQGLILSEYPLGAGPVARHFPQRNRIIAGLSLACLVIEASVRSGSLITARQAAAAGRDVMAVPGSIHHAGARGCHRLIKEGAALIETVDDILDQVGRLQAESPASPPPGQPHPVLDAIGTEPVSIDELGPRLGLTVAELYEILLQLELEGRVAPLPGGRFQRIDPPPVESHL
ncbi:DNA-processing protein DprA [Paludibacterium sp. THUN1379]|uniref:DNA-processing protein DprA n=1 Tax=Paludibacterium sp. THUN1379 TaxID=3112107 RepID=UPI003091F033|nr:DNA-processing protein DprA [Paludibacterium sp. THUN1379]